MTLKDLKIGQSALVKVIGGDGELRQHFLDMGLLPGVIVTLVKFAPMGDPIEVRIRGYELTLRLSEAEKISVSLLSGEDEEKLGEKSAEKVSPMRVMENCKSKSGCANCTAICPAANHLGLGEGGKYHDKAGENPLPKGTALTFALAGNQNCGKTTLFNQLTGSNQHVGNFPGVTVDQKTGEIQGYGGTQITDLPGIYSLSPYSSEEIVTREFILKQKPAAIINIVDATNIERNLYLTMQLMDLDIPMVVALNMMDEMRGNGGTVGINEMEAMLGLPVVPISAAKGEGIDELVTHAIHVAKYQEKPLKHDFCDESENGGAVHRCLHGIMNLIQDHAEHAQIPVRFAATKLIEGDDNMLRSLYLDENEKDMLEHIITQMEAERGLDRCAAIADMRFSFIEKTVNSCVVKPHESKEHTRSKKIDKILTGKYTALPAFVLIMAAVFFLTFQVIGPFFQDLLAKGIEFITVAVDGFLTRLNVSAAIHSLIIDGIFTGVGSVISFLPIIVTLFFFLSLLEDTGYMARVAFVMDKLLRKIGLSGRSIVPMLIGFGCTVPGVMASRTLPSERDRKMTILLTPFISCSAKLPIYGFFAQAFFPKISGLVMIILYFAGIIIGIGAALLFKNTIFKGEPVPFVMELPNYRMPGVRNTVQLLWEKTKDFFRRAFTIILVSTIVIWFLQTFSPPLKMVTDSSESLLALLAGLIAPIFAPIGCGNWKIVSALISGVLAKESVVSTLTVLFAGANITEIMAPAAAAALLVFCLLYTPCVAAVAAVKRELGGKWAAGMIIFQCVVAWIFAFITYLICGLFMI